MTMNGGGADLIEAVAASLDDPRREEIVALAELTNRWIREGARGRRSLSHLTAGDARERRRFSSVADADPHAIEVALLRAQRELSDEPLAMRIGLNDVDKQARNTDDLWPSTMIGRQRGARRVREGRLMIVSSKNFGFPTLPGATAVVRPRQLPTAAVREVLRTIHEADPEARIVAVELDDFDASVARLQRRALQPFTLRVPGLVHEAGFEGPVALFLEPVPPISRTPVGGARDITGLRIGVRGGWSEPYPAEVEVAGPDDEIERQPVVVRVSAELSVGDRARGFRARVARVTNDQRDGVRVPPEPRLVAVLQLEDPEAIAELAAKTLSATDDHPHIAAFMRARTAARVFQGEQQTRQALHVDRAIASIAVAAHLLEQFVGA
jgi:hypothetical protein